jgi:hypothetical protein
MTLGERQRLFTKLVPKLIDFIYKSGYEVSLGDAWSKPEYKAHMVNSNHYIRLAIDLNLFKNGTYLTDTTSHKPFGEFWESLHPLCRWGGRFKDGNHYEIINPAVPTA